MLKVSKSLWIGGKVPLDSLVSFTSTQRSLSSKQGISSGTLDLPCPSDRWIAACPALSMQPEDTTVQVADIPVNGSNRETVTQGQFQLRPGIMAQLGLVASHSNPTMIERSPGQFLARRGSVLGTLCLI